MNHTETLANLRSQYFVLSKEFLIALQNDRPSDELEEIRQRIKLVVSRMEELESEPGSDQ